MATSKKNISLVTLKKEPTDFVKVKITSSNVAADYMKQFYFDDMEIYESVFLLMLNNSNQTIQYAKISQGGVTGTVVDVKIVCKYAIDNLCTNVILAHNHPSGKLKPSCADEALTKKVKEALKIMDVTLTDHLILTTEGYYSFADNGLL